MSQAEALEMEGDEDNSSNVITVLRGLQWQNYVTDSERHVTSFSLISTVKFVAKWKSSSRDGSDLSPPEKKAFNCLKFINYSNELSGK